MSTADTRAEAIINWLTHSLSFNIIQFEIASSDASFRRYFRVIHNQGQHIVMDAPPGKENIEPFIRIATLLKQAGLNVPQIYHQDLAQGFLLLEDFGNKCFLDQLNEENATELYCSAFNSLHQLQSSSSLTDGQLPNYDEALLTRELRIFYDWFLEQSLALSIPKNIQQNFNQILITSALEQAQTCVHRDFHCRNLMLLTENSPGIIDFQDAVIGPITYDLVSLLRDCYISWPEEEVLNWMEEYFQKITALGLINTDLATFTRWFDLMGLQRHLKAIGIFSRLNLRDGKPDYLADIPRTLNYVSHICSKYPELAEFNHYFVETILPAYNSKK
jgi:aminoglycoside/choline kinase family phosphotransferase